MQAIRQALEALRTAPDERAVQMLLTNCLSSLPAEDLRMLPDDAKARIADRNAEIHDVAVALLRSELTFSGDAEAKHLLFEVAHLYAGAASRIGHIRTRVHRQRT